MRVQIAVVQQSGSHYHRLINPMVYMPWKEGDEHTMLWLGQNEVNINCDILYYSKYIATPTAMLEDMKKRTGMKTVVDIDDMWTLSPGHVNYESFKSAGLSDIIEEHIKLADLVTCTSMLLQDKIRPLNKNTVVIPNAFPFGRENYMPNPQPRQKIAFIYVGGSTHHPDVKLLEGKFRRISSIPQIKNNAEFILAGYEKAKQKKFLTKKDRDENNNNFVIEDRHHETYDLMKGIFAHTGSYRVIPSTNQDEYVDFYDQADVSLVPLVDNTWNSYKSVLKITEAGLKGILCVCSKVQPYWPELQNYPGILWVEKPDDWLTHIKWCINNPQGVRDMGQQLHERVKQDYELTTWNQVRYDLFTKLLA